MTNLQNVMGKYQTEKKGGKNVCGVQVENDEIFEDIKMLFSPK